MKIDYTSLNEDKLFINKSTSNCTIKSDFEKIFAVEAVKYPFLPKSQIKNRIMTIMKKKNISLPRCKRYQYSGIKKLSKLEPSLSKRYKNMEDNQSFKETPAKFPSKKSLVPLKVDFVSNSSNGVLKRNSSGTREKRRVSFNKELYIRYRTTSEESSSSTLKGKKHQLKKNYNQYWTQEFVRSQKDNKFDKLINKKCSWSYRLPKVTHKNISMEITKESVHAPNNYLDEVQQNKLEPVINNKLLEESKDNDLCISDESYLEKNTLCNSQKDAQNESVELSKGETYNNEISNEEFVDENSKDTVGEMLKTAQLELSANSKKVSDEKNIQETLNDSEVSGDSSSDEEILQSRFPVQDEECNSPQSSTSFACISDNEGSLENDSEIKRPSIIQTMAYEENKPVDCKTNSSNSEINKQAEKNDHQEADTDRANYSFLSVDVDNSNIETESSYMQNSIINKNTDLNFDETEGENKILPQEIVETAKNEKILDQNTQERNNLSPDIVIENFFNGSFDISIFKPEKNSTMIKDDWMVTKQKHLMKDEIPPSKKKKYIGNVHKNTNNNKEAHNGLDYSGESKHKKMNNDNKPAADSMAQLKRKISQTQTENSKKARVVKGKNKDKITDIISDKLTLKAKSKPENKYSKANNQHKRVNNRSQYDDKDIPMLNNFDIIEDNTKKNKTKRNTGRTKLHKNMEIFKDFSKNITPLKKSRNLRNSSLVASKKIKEIEKLENTYSDEEILLDSDSSCFDSNLKEIEDSFISIFKYQKPPPKYKAENKLEKEKFQQGTTDTSLEGFQTCFEKQGKKERTAGSNRNDENKIENIFDTCHKIAKCQLKMTNITSEENFVSDPYEPDFLVEENGVTNEKYLNNKKKISNRRQSKSNKRTENKILEYGKNIDKTTPFKKDTKSIMNYGVATRSKKRTWDTLEKELLGELNDVPFSNSVTNAVPLNKQTARKQSTQDVDLHSSMIQTVSMPHKRNKYDGKYKIQEMESKYLETPANNMQSNEIVPYKSKSIVEKAIARMERCTADFLTPRKNFLQKEWKCGGLKLDDMSDEISIDQEAEFHSNMTFITKESEKFYKNEIIAIVKQCSSIKHETPRRHATRTTYNDEEYSYGFSDAEHLIKKSIITESYSVKGSSEEDLKTKSQALIPSSNEKQSEPWSRLIKELNLEQCNNENRGKAISSEKPKGKSISYHENLKQYTHAHPNTDGGMQLTLDLNKRKFYKQGEIEKEKNKQVLKQITFEETPTESNYMATCNDLNVEDNCIINTEPKINYKKAELSSVSAARKTTRKIETKEKSLQMKKVKTSPKFKLKVEDGGVKFKRCNKSFSSSSEEFEERKQRNIKQDDKKLPKDQQKYKKYLSNLFEEEKSKNNKIEPMSEEKNSKKYPIIDKNTEHGKMISTLIAKEDDDLFSISSSDSEPVNKGKGLLCDLFDE